MPASTPVSAPASGGQTPDDDPAPEDDDELLDDEPCPPLPEEDEEDPYPPLLELDEDECPPEEDELDDDEDDVIASLPASSHGGAPEDEPLEDAVPEDDPTPDDEAVPLDEPTPDEDEAVPLEEPEPDEEPASTPESSPLSLAGGNTDAVLLHAATSAVADRRERSVSLRVVFICFVILCLRELVYPC